MTKTGLRLIAVVMLFAGATSAHAGLFGSDTKEEGGAQASSSLGICDANEVFFKCAAIQEFGKHREARMKEYQKTFTEREAALRAEHQKLEEKMKLGKDVFDKAQKQFQAKVDAERKRGEEARKRVDMASAEVEKKVKGEILKIIAELQKEKKLGTVLDKGAILVSSEAVDLTSDVLQKLNKAMPKVDIKIPAVDAKA